MRQHRGQLAPAEQLQGADGQDDLGAQPGQAIGRRGGIVDDQGAGHLRVAVGQQRQQDPLPAPGLQGRHGRGDEDPAQRGEQGQARGQAGEPQDQQHGRPDADDSEGRRGPQRGVGEDRAQMHDGAGHADVLPGQAQADQRADGGQARDQAERLPQHDGRGRRAARPAGLHQGRRPQHAAQGDCGQKRRVSQCLHLLRRHLRLRPAHRAGPRPRRRKPTGRTGSGRPCGRRFDPVRSA